MLPSVFLTPGFAGAALLLLVSVVMALGHDDSLRTARALILMAPLFVWLRWPIQDGRWRLVRHVSVGFMLCLFVLDGMLRAHFLHRYQAVPDSSMVLAAVANTNARESFEYLGSLSASFWAALGAGMAMAGLVFLLTMRSNRHQVPLGRLTRWGLIALLVLACIGFASKHWRRYHPVLYWANWLTQVSQLRTSLSSQEDERAQLLRNAESVSPTFVAAGPSTVVWVITDSVNRDNMSLYGYPRDTTPQLKALSKEAAGEWLTFANAWSAEAGTLASLSGIFSFGQRRHDEPPGSSQHILALARAAGYRIWWMSNHDDIAIDQQHAQLAHHVDMINRQPGRSSVSLDGDLLDCLEEALTDPAPRKLIVVHLLGAHPDYGKRVPEGFRPFDARTDGVDEAMRRAGRPIWLREMRHRYDAAIAYHDQVVAETLRRTRRHAPQGGDAAWLYQSDHGQEVGHSLDKAGHSANTPAGYRIPTLAWRKRGLPGPEIGQRPFRADWTAPLVAQLLQISWDRMAHHRNVLHEGYAWEPLDLPLDNVAFDR